MHESYQNSLPLHNVGVEGGHSSIDTSGSSRDAYDILPANGKIFICMPYELYLD